MNIFGYKGWKRKLTKYKPAEVIDMFVKDVAPMFKAAGYKKQGRVWTKDMGEFSFIITIQASPWNGVETGAQFDATYNIFVPKVFKALQTYEQPNHPKGYDCAFGQNISGSHQPIPWEIFDNTDIEALKPVVSKQLQEQCIDAFAKISTLEDVKVALMEGLFVEDQQHIVGLAVLCAELGDPTNAKRYFDEAITNQTRTQAYRDTAEEIARRYNLA